MCYKFRVTKHCLFKATKLKLNFPFIPFSGSADTKQFQIGSFYEKSFEIAGFKPGPLSHEPTLIATKPPPQPIGVTS